jgi:hypothetical protein
LKEPELREQLGEALKNDSGAAFKIMLRRSGLLAKINSSANDFRWAALRAKCTFEKPDIVALAQERDEIRRILDDASSIEGSDKLLISGLRERYRCTLLDEALIVAAGHGDEDQVSRLLDMGADANAVGQHGQRPLTAAAFCGYGSGVLRMLLEQGGTEAKATALKIARSYGQEENIRVLEAHI